MALALIAATAYIAVAETDTPEARARLVDEYFTYLPMTKMMDDMVREVSKQVPEAKQQEFVDTLPKNIRLDVIETAARQSIEKHPPVSELEVFVAFIKKP